jgi:sortase B
MIKHLKKILFYTVILVLVAVFVYSGYSLIAYYMDSRQSQQAYDNLAQYLVDRPTIPLPSGSQSSDSETPEETEPAQLLVSVQNPQTGETVQVLPEYAQLYTRNPDLVGWISIDGTKINYPVVQSSLDNANYYLDRNFERKHSAHGCIYVSEAADVFAPSDNVTIYGHRMGDHSMFGQLGLYTDKAFWKEHQYIRFDTLQERHLYQIICVFSTTATMGQGFAYHSFVDAEDSSNFNAYVWQSQKLSYYDTGITAQFGDKLITLSTCEYTNTHGRLVVVAKRIS